MVRIFITFFFTITFFYNTQAQTDSLFVTQQNGVNLVSISSTEVSTLQGVANMYNVSADIISLFNQYTFTDKIPANESVLLPLTETNYFKLSSMNAQMGYLPIYYQPTIEEKVIEISKRFLVSESTLYKWNALNSQDIIADKAILVGWLKTNQTQNNIVVVGKKTSYQYTKDDTFSKDIKADYANAKAKVKSAAHQISKGIKTITTPKPKLVTPIVQTENVVVEDTLDVVPAGFASSKSRSLQRTYINSKETVKEGVNKVGTTVNKGITKVTKIVNRGYQQEKLEREARLNAAQLPKKINTEVPAINNVAKQELQADAEIINNDTTISAKEVASTKDEVDIPKYINENADANIYDLAGSTPKAELNNTASANGKEINPKSGKAITFYSGSEGMHLAITDYAPKDAKILVENKKNGKKIMAKVLGPMNKNSEEEAGLLILLSDTVKKELQPSGENFMVEISLINE